MNYKHTYHFIFNFSIKKVKQLNSANIDQLDKKLYGGDWASIVTQLRTNIGQSVFIE